MSNIKKESGKIDEKDQPIDFKAEFHKVISHWKIFSVSIIILLAISYLYTRYTTPVYKVECTILIKDESKSKSLASSTFVQELDIFKDQKKLENEIGILKSKYLSRKTVKDLGLYVTYLYKSKNLGRSIETYENCPFYIEVDTTHLQLINTPIKISFSSDSTFEITIENNSYAFFYNFSTQKTFYNTIPANISKKLKYNDTFETEYAKFKILRRNIADSSSIKMENSNINATDYTVTISNPIETGKAFSEDISVATINKDATIVILSINTNIPQKAADFLNKLSENYINLDLEEKNLTATRAISFIDDQLAEISDSLSNVEDVLENFRLKNQVTDISESSQLVFDKLSEQDKEKAIINIQYKYYEYLIAYINDNKEYSDIIIPSSIGITDVSMNSLVTKLITLSTEKNKIALSSTDKNPYYTSILNSIEETKTALLKNIENSLEVTKISLKDVNERLSLTETEINKLPKKERQLLSIQRKFNVSDQIYNYLLEKKAEASIAKASNFSTNKIIDRAELSANVHPKKKLFYFLALLLGLLLPYIFIKVKEYLNDTVLDRTDIEKHTSLPIIGVIAHSRYESNKVLISNPRSMVSETIRSVKANIDFIATNKTCNILAVTSTISGEGKTHTSINLACAYAISDKKTLLIGADLRKPKIYKDFNLKNDVGLSTFLIGKAELDEIIQPTDIPNLYVLPSGPIPPNPSELLVNNRMHETYELLRKKFDYIIFDTPPIGIVSDALSIMKYADANIYVLRYNFTDKKVLIDLNDVVKSTDISNICIVLNDVVFDKKSKRYGYGYTYRYDESYYIENE